MDPAPRDEAVARTFFHPGPGAGAMRGTLLLALAAGFTLLTLAVPAAAHASLDLPCYDPYGPCVCPPGVLQVDTSLVHAHTSCGFPRGVGLGP